MKWKAPKKIHKFNQQMKYFCGFSGPSKIKGEQLRRGGGYSETTDALISIVLMKNHCFFR